MMAGTTDKKAEIVGQVFEILEDAITEDPVKDLVVFGNALMQIGNVLIGVDQDDAIRIVRAAAALHGIDVP